MIDLNLRKNRQKDFFMPKNRFIKLNNDWQIYDNANLSIHVTDKCNADCAFCIAHLRYLNDGNIYLKPEIDSDNKYYERLNSILNIVKQINPSVSITGGEPTVNRKIGNILDILSSHNVRKRTITTNASGLFYKLNENKTVLDKLVDYKLEHLNISRAHYDNDKNSFLMTMNKNLITNEKLSEMVKEAKNNNIKIRFSCALLKDGISSYEDIQKYIEFAYNMGADNIIFRQLMKFDEQKVTPGRIPIFCKEQEVDLESIWNNFDSNKNLEFYHQVLGYYYYVEVRKLKSINNIIVEKDINIVSEAADLKLINPQLAKYKNYYSINTAFEMIYHPNGNLCAGWNENENIMDLYNE